MWDELIKFFVVFFVVVEPVSLVPLFAALTTGAQAGYRERMALKAVLIAFAIIVLFAFAGAWFIRAMGITIDAFKIGGGIMLFVIALDMVFAQEHGQRTTAPETQECQQRADISVFPLAFPFIAGPGSLATILLAFGDQKDPWLFAGLLCVVAIVLVITLLLMFSTPWVMRVLGITGANVVSRLSGVILAALAVQYIIDGIRSAFFPLQIAS